MSGNGIDFVGLSSYLLNRSRELLSMWLPGGKIIGQEYCCGDLSGRPGDSLKVNINTGKWADFATNDKGGDLISLYAAIEGLPQKDAATQLAEMHNYALSKHKPVILPPTAKLSDTFVAPPKGTLLPKISKKHAGLWKYKNEVGETLFLVYRFDETNGKKSFQPWCYTSEGNWVSKHWPTPRPLYNLDQLVKNPKRPVLILEGEKSCEAASKIVGDRYVCTTWAAGSNSFSKTDWSPLYGRRILLWPDNDEPGFKAMIGIDKILSSYVESIKIIDVRKDNRSIGWDAADAFDEGFKYTDYTAFANCNITDLKTLPPYCEVKTQDKNLVVPTAEPVGKIPDPKSCKTTIINNTAVFTSEEMIPRDNPSLSAFGLWQSIGLTTQKNGEPHINLMNVIRILETDERFKTGIWIDTFHCKKLTTLNSTSPREWTDYDDLAVLSILQSEYSLVRMTIDPVRQAIDRFAYQNKRSEPLDWINSLTWDGVDRTTNFFSKYLGTEDNEYIRAASRNWWIGMAARIIKPGCKVDTMIILEGAQGTFKSTVLSTIAGKWYATASDSITTKDFTQSLQGVLIMEIAELDAFSRAETTQIKRVVSEASDRFRPPYGRATMTFPRQCVFAGTTNDSHYLTDSTGARRMWPIAIGKIDLEAVAADRDQLFAEATALFKQGHTWHEMPVSALDEQEARREADEWESHVYDYVHGRHEVTITEIATAVECIALEIKTLDRKAQLRIGRALRIAGWESRGKRDSDGRLRKRWYPKSKVTEQQKLPTISAYSLDNVPRYPFSH